ncbi:MAG: SdpI family protein [Erysipelotrichaceae bacterium]|nr:SdpI family protein [Erysipelotrichaceae bacterium]
MKKINKTVITTLVCLIPMVAGLLLYDKLPDTIATHWGMNDNPDGYSSKFAAVFVFPAIMALVNIFVPLIMKADPKEKNMDENLKNVVYWIIPLISLLCSVLTISEGMGIHINISGAVPIVLGVMFAYIGNYMPKTRQSYTMGVRLPWTLNSEENWNRTHRIAGFVWVIGGLLMVLVGIINLLGYSAVSTILLIVSIIIMVFVPCIYSYILYRKENI